MKTLILPLLALATSAFAQQSMREWVNPACASGACEIRGMRLHILKANDRNGAGNSMAAELIATDRADLSKYGFVQYLKGCHYKSNAVGEATVGTRQFFGEQAVSFNHPRWAIDTAADRDPVYSSTDEHGFDELRGYHVPRNARYSVQNPISTAQGVSWAGQQRLLRSNSLFIHDMPTPGISVIGMGGIRESVTPSLQFKVCLHKLSDIPEETSNPELEVPNPITCMEWSSIYNYNAVSRRYVEGRTISPVCATLPVATLSER
jgi:hypothetical protein